MAILVCCIFECVHDVHFLSFINSQKQFHFLPAALLSSLGRVFIYSGSLCALLSSCSVFPKVQQKNNKFEQLVDKTDDLGRLIVFSRPDNLDCQNLKIFFQITKDKISSVIKIQLRWQKPPHVLGCKKHLHSTIKMLKEHIKSDQVFLYPLLCIEFVLSLNFTSSRYD